MDTAELKKLGVIIAEGGVFYYPTNDSQGDFKEFRKNIIKLGIVDFPFDKVKELSQQEIKQPVKICDELKEYNPAKDDLIRITISRDHLEAYLDITYPAGGEPITVNDVLHKIYKAGVIYNVDEDKIQKIVKNKIFAEREVIAVGKDAEFGTEAQIVLEVDTEVSSEPLIMDDGSVDFHQVSMLRTVEKDQLLAVKIPAQKGVDGISVLGESIDSTGKDKPLPAGKNTSISEDGLSLSAAANGRILREKELLQVENILALEGDVDFSTGNIEFNGDIAISGDVLTGFRVKSSGGDVRIKGTVEGAEIIATEGNVYVARGIVGQQKARILAKVNVRADFINEAAVEAGQDVEVGEYILNSSIQAERDVRAMEGRGLIIGGRVYAEREIEAKAMGSPNNVRTEIRVGGKVDKALYEKLLYIEKDSENLQKRRRGIQKEIGFIELLKKKLPKFPEEKAKELAELHKKIIILDSKITEVTAKKAEMTKDLGSSFPEDQKKIVANTVHRGVLLGIDQNKLLTEYTYRLLLVYSKEGEMKINYKSRYV